MKKVFIILSIVGLLIVVGLKVAVVALVNATGGVFQAPPVLVKMERLSLPPLSEPVDIFGYPAELSKEYVEQLGYNNAIGSLDSLCRRFDTLSRTDYRFEYHVPGILERIAQMRTGISCINQWVEQYPQSPFSYLAKAQFHVESAWKARTYATIDKVSEEQLATMEREMAIALSCLDSVAARDSLVLYQWMLRQQIYHTIGPKQKVIAAYQQSMERNPYLVSPRMSLMNSLRPRWYGAERAMKAFADQCDSLSPYNPRFRAVRSIYLEDLADAAYFKGDTAKAGDIYALGLRCNPYDSDIFSSVAYIGRTQGKHQDVLKLCRQRTAENPTDSAGLVQTCETLYAMMDEMTSKTEAFPLLLELRDNNEKILRYYPGHERAKEFQEWYSGIIEHSDPQGYPL